MPIAPQCRIVRRHVAKGAPHALERSRVGVEHDDAPVAVAVGDEELVGRRMHEDVGRLPQVARVGVGLLLSPAADLHHELAGLRELEDLVVVAVPADPHEALVVDEDAVFGAGPLVAVARAAPALDVVAGGVELHHRRSGLLAGAHYAGAMEHPDMIVRVGGGARYLTQGPAVRNFRPRRVDLEQRTFGTRRVCESSGDDDRRDDQEKRAGHPGSRLADHIGSLLDDHRLLT